MLTGTTPEANVGMHTQSSPITFVNKQSPPTLILYGIADSVVLLSQSEKLRQALQAAEVSHEFAVFNGETHGWWRPAAQSLSFDRIVAFLHEYLP